MTTIDPAVILAFSTGLLGSGHCLGMCGGIVAALSLSVRDGRGHFLFHCLYHAGRIITYTAAGIVLGRLGSMLAYTDRFHLLMRAALIGSDLFIIVVGVAGSGLVRGPGSAALEFAAPARILARPTAMLKRLPPALAALPLGLLMGFLPCGFSYTVAITAAQSASPRTGGLMMLAFGLGTAPALLLFGSAAHWLGTRARQRMIHAAGGMVAVLGLYHLIRHLLMLGWTLDRPLQFLCH